VLVCACVRVLDRYATGGSVPGLLPQLPTSVLNATNSVNNTGNMFEKLSTFDIGIAGSGGEYTGEYYLASLYRPFQWQFWLLTDSLSSVLVDTHDDSASGLWMVERCIVVVRVEIWHDHQYSELPCDYGAVLEWNHGCGGFGKEET
jgi:hypothetical protein